MQFAEICIDWYHEVLINNVIVSSTYLYTTCTGGDEPGGDPGSSSSGSGSSPSDPCAPPPPPPPPGPGPIVVVTSISGGHITVNNVPGGGGFMPPVDEGGPCGEQADIINNVKNPCLKSMVDATINVNINTKVNSLIQSVFGDNNGSLNLTFSDDFPMVNTSDDAEDAPIFNNGDPTQGLISTSVHLNASTLSSSSQEFIAATIMHEVLHSYLDSKGIDIGDDQHTAMAANYINTMATDLMQMFPGLIKDAAYSLAWAGLEKTYAYSHPGDVYFPQYQADINTLYRAHTDGQGRFFGHGCNN